MAVEGDRIIDVGRGWKADFDLGDTILLPGLVNAHCHLEFSHLKGKTSPGRPFTDWVREVSSLVSDGRPDPVPGIDRLLKTGTTALADHCSPETDYFETPFRRTIFWEVLGAERNRGEDSLRKAAQKAESHGGFVSPHSLYGVHAEILAKIDSPQASIHFLESEDEDEWFRKGSGPLADLIRERNGNAGAVLRDRPLQGNHIGLPRLLVHANYLNAAEIAALRGSGAFVIHCPGSHQFFGHRRFPLEDLRAAGVRVALGTDSLASNEDLSMLREIRLLKEAYPALDETEILRMATVEGAAALGLEREIGTIETGKKADLIAVKKNIFEAERVVFSMIGGKVRINDV